MNEWNQIQWEVLKYGVPQFSRKVSKTSAKELGGELRILENKLKVYEQNLIWFKNEDYCC